MEGQKEELPVDKYIDMLFWRDVRIDYHIIYYIKSLDTDLLPKSMLCSKGEAGPSDLSWSQFTGKKELAIFTRPSLPLEVKR